MFFYESVNIKVDGKIVIFPPNSLMIWPKRTGHFYGNPEHKWTHSWIHCDGSWIPKILTESKIVPGRVLQLNDQTLVEKYLFNLYTELTHYQNPDPIILQNIFHSWIRELSRIVPDDDAKFIIPERMLRVKRAIDVQFHNKFSLKQLAAMACLSVPHFCAQFKLHWGFSPIHYLIHVRLQHARYLLFNRNLSIREVASSVGYDNLFHFSKLFKKCFGVSPRTMRRSE